MKVLIHFDESAYKKEKQVIENIAANLLQPVVEQYHGLGIEPLMPAELQKLFSTPADLVFDKITGGNLSIGNVAVEKEKAIAMVSKPDGYEKMLQMIDSVWGNLKGERRQPGNAPINSQNIASFFILNDSKEVVLNPAIDEKLKAWYQKFAASEKAVAAFNFSTAFISLCQQHSINKLGAIHKESIGTFINELVNKDSNTGNLSIKAESILRLNQ